MDKRAYLADRISYIALYLFSLGVIVLVVQLDLSQTGQALKWFNMAYLSLLSLLALGAFLLYDYSRQRVFFRQIKDLTDHSTTSLESALNLKGAVTVEQSYYTKAIHEQYRLYTDELVAYRGQQELRDHFVQRWVHQMKTPLSVIDLMLQEQPGGMDLEFWHSFRDEKDKLAAGLEMMLNQSRLERFPVDLSIGQVYVVAIMRQVLNQLKSSFIRAKVYPRIEASHPEVHVETDEKWLSFVLNQLLVNAIKYSRVDDGRSREILLRLQRGSDAWCLTVQDEGVGIVPEDLGRIFQPFFTGENGRRFPEATGMGLYLVAEVCRQLGHEISVSSEKDRGTTFTLRFPDSHALHKLRPPATSRTTL